MVGGKKNDELLFYKPLTDSMSLNFQRDKMESFIIDNEIIINNYNDYNNIYYMYNNNRPTGSYTGSFPEWGYSHILVTGRCDGLLALKFYRRLGGFLGD